MLPRIVLTIALFNLRSPFGRLRVEIGDPD